MKWLFILVLLIVSKVTYANYHSTIPEISPKDVVIISFLCRTENDILEVVAADEKSSESAALLNKHLALSNCVMFSRPTFFIVEEIIYEYVDFQNKNSVVLRVSSSYAQLSGYTISFGKAKKETAI